MHLDDLVLIYLFVGLCCGAFIYRSSSAPRPRALASAAVAVPLWPLWAPIALASPRASTVDRSAAAGAAAKIEAALEEAAAACADSSLSALLPRDAAARISAEVKRASARHAELSALLGREGFDLESAKRRVESLEREGASTRALATARLHAENVARLWAMRERDARALDELSELVAALRTQLVLARFAGSSVEGTSGIVSEVWARVEGLGAALGEDCTVGEGYEA